jgi:hypothetical protein
MEKSKNPIAYASVMLVVMWRISHPDLACRQTGSYRDGISVAT